MKNFQVSTAENRIAQDNTCYLPMICQESVSELDNKIWAAMWRNNIVGLSAAVFQDNQIIWSNGYGYADLRTDRQATPETVYRIASISKMITATALMQLYDQGKFQLDDDISRYLGYVVRNPKYPNILITFRQLLTHTSSIVDEGTYNKVVEETPALLKDIDIKDFFVPGSPYYSPENFANYPPGAGFTYANLGFNLIGSLVEVISGERFDKYTIRHIFAPLQMDASFDPADIQNWKNFAVLYKFDKDKGIFVPARDDYRGEKPQRLIVTAPLGSALGWGPTGAARMNVLDLAKFMLAHVQGGMYDCVRILAKNTADLMHQMQWFGNGLEGLYKQKGLGFHITDDLVPGQRLVGHPGEAEGLVGDAYFDPDTKFGFVFLMNGGIWGSAKPFYQIENTIATILYNQFAPRVCWPVRTICGTIGGHTICVNGRRIVLPSSAGIEGPDFVPEMTAADVLKAAIELDEGKTTLTFRYGGNSVTFKVGYAEMLVNDRMVALPKAPYGNHGHIMVPLATLGQALKLAMAFCYPSGGHM
jgi:CubicO group peptidase (beta-lactamase class C family)